jgi:hypothetical protein
LLISKIMIIHEQMLKREELEKRLQEKLAAEKLKIAEKVAADAEERRKRTQAKKDMETYYRLVKEVSSNICFIYYEIY